MINLRHMLPGKAKETLTEHLFQKFEQSPLNCYENPTFDYVKAMKEIDDTDEYAKGILHQCFLAAEKRYEKKHPKCWDVDKQRAYRE